jgi:hypothetical protein
MTVAVGFLRLCQVGPDGIVMVGADTSPTRYGRLASYNTAPPESRFLRPLPGSELTEE